MRTRTSIELSQLQPAQSASNWSDTHKTASTQGALASAALLCMSVILSLTGCSGEKPSDRPHVVPTRGTVTFKGKPLPMAEVMFMNAEAQRTGFGMTDEDGNFFLTTFEHADGVVPGEQAVAIRRVDIINKTPPNVEVNDDEGGRRVEVKWIVPEKYSNFQKSGLTAHVRNEQENIFQFDIP